MTRRTMIIMAGIALMIGLYLYDRDRQTLTVLPASVILLEDQDNEAGPDSWHLIVRIGEDEIALEELEKRPVVKPGDTICVNRIQRAGRTDEYRFAPSANC